MFPGTLPSPPWRRAATLVAVAFSLIFLGSATTGSGAVDWVPCADAKGLACARVTVPLDWTNPSDPRTISLAVIKRPASRPAERIGSLFVNFGGPGVSGVDTVRRIGPRLDRLGLGRFDVVGWDPRGVGSSAHFTCFPDDRTQARYWGALAIPTTPAESRAFLPRAVGFGRRCAARNRLLARYASTADTARDLDHLRELVGDRALNYRGLSYGTFIGQTYSNLFPDRVRAMVLDGNIDPLTYTSTVADAIAAGNADTDRVIGAFLRLCRKAGPTRCALARGGSPERRYGDLLARLQRGDTVPAPAADPPVLTYSDLLLRVFVGQGGPAGWPDLARDLDAAARGDGSDIARFGQAIGPGLAGALDSAVPLQCADKRNPPGQGPAAWPGVVRRLDRVSVYDGPVLAWILWAPCSTWPVPAVNRYTGPWDAATPNPILVIGTRFDPRTAYRSSVIAARTLGNAVLLTHDGYGHTSDEDPSACIQRRVAAYLIDLTSPPRGTVCRSDHVPFSADFGPPLG